MAIGFDLGCSQSPILPVYCRDLLTAFKMCKRLEEEGVFVNPVVAPAVPAGKEMIRISLMATHTDPQLDFALEKLSKVGTGTGPDLNAVVFPGVQLFARGYEGPTDGCERFCRQPRAGRVGRKGIPTTVLVRQASSKRFIEAQLSRVNVRLGTILDRESLRQATADATHVIHCAGCIKALRPAEFYEVNQIGTRNVVAAVNDPDSQVGRLVHISSLAAVGPATAEAPARESQTPKPVTDYGRSKLAAEEEVTGGCRTEFVILRPPAVYGPRDTEFLRLFKMIRRHLCPIFGGQTFSMVFVKDLAEATVACLTNPEAGKQIFNVASHEIVTSHTLSREIAAQMGVRTLTLHLPLAFLWWACAGQELLSRLTSRPSVLSRQKYRELGAPGWVCDPTLLRTQAGFVCQTSLPTGVSQTLTWYRLEGWL